jgi:hypothetical protein
VNKLGFMLLVVIVVVCIMLWKRPKASLATIAPAQCVFQVDEHWSPGFQASIIASIKNSYETSKNPDLVITKTTTDYPAVESIQAQICSADKICFYIESIQPVFMLNNSHVVGVGGVVSSKDEFCEQVQQELPKVFAHINLKNIESNAQQLSDMVHFIEQLSPVITQEHDVDWRNGDDVILQPHLLSNMHCVTRMGKIPLVEDVASCHKLHQLQLASKSKKKSKQSIMEYDIRFKNQIIVRSGG